MRLEGKDAVNLSFTNPNIRMFYTKRKELLGHKFAVITLDPELLRDAKDGYEFRSTNAASASSQPCNVEEVFTGNGRPDFFDPSWPTDNQAEILVKGGIGPKYIKTIQLPYSEKDDPAAKAIAENLLELVKQLGLHCEVVFCEKHFDYSKALLGEFEPKKSYEYYLMSWAEDEHAATVAEEATRLIDRKKIFDSVAFSAEAVEAARIEPDADVLPYAVWSLTCRVLAAPQMRSNAQLSAFAVIEKIINRGRRTRLSPGLEAQLGSDVEIVLAHQAQCAMVELLKSQALRPGHVISCRDNGQGVLLKVVELALKDLKSLSTAVAELYSCDDFLADVSFVNNEAEADLVFCWSDEDSSVGNGEVRITGLRKIKAPVPIDFTRVVEPVPINADYEALCFLVHYIFGFDGFREGQLEAIKRGLRREDTIVLLPTGSGKSVVFQLLSLITPGMAFVVCPIISLIEDQITNLRLRGIDRVMGLSSAMDSDSRNATLENITAGQYLICYVAPERFQNMSFNESVHHYASTNLISTVAVDEAHCVSEWGHEFRTAYLGLAHTCRTVCSTGDATPPVLALTGTASSSVLTDMVHDLEIDDDDAIIQPSSFDRPEIHYRVIKIPSEQKQAALQSVIDELIPSDFGADPNTFYVPMGNKSNCGIVLCSHVNGSYGLMASERQKAAGHLGVWDYMDARLPGLCSYYSGSAPKRISVGDSKWNKEKRNQAAQFKGNETTVMVATKAFGMGINKPNVRWVVHYGMPSSLESYYQEVGRAARDRKPAYAYLLLSDDFHQQNEELLDPVKTPVTELKEKDEDAKGKWNDDDVSRAVFFHANTFAGVEKELEAANEVLDACGAKNYRGGQWFVPFPPNAKERRERAIYRFCILGVFEGYAIDYSSQNGIFVITPNNCGGEELRSHIVDSYLNYVKAYQPDSAYLDAARKNVLAAVGGAENDRDYIMRAMRHLLTDFVYKVLEEGRRRAVKTMLDAACKAAEAESYDQEDQILRSQMLAYLSTDEQSQKRKGHGIRALLSDATNLKLILKVLAEGKNENLLGSASRLLEDYPQHYGLHFVQAAVYALEDDISHFGPALSSMTNFGTANYGLSVEQCQDNFMAFLNSPKGKHVSAEAIDEMLPVMSDCFGRSEGELLSLMKSSQAKMVRKIDSLYSIAYRAMEGLKWIRRK